MKLEVYDDCLLEGKFYDLYDAIKDDDVSTVECIFTQSDKLKFEILNGALEIPPLDHGPFNEDVQFIMKFNINRMWHLAVSYSSFKVVALFMKENVNHFQTDDDGNNVFHVLTTGAFFCPIHEQRRVVKAYNYLCENLSTDVIKALHMATNKQKLRPLELAASLGTMRVFKAMIRTPGIYHTFCQPHGMYEIHWYDITEYEYERTFMSPLAGLMSIEEHKLSDPVVHEVYESVLIQHWMDMKKKSLRKFLVISICNRIFYAAMFLLFMLSKCSMELRRLAPNVASQVCPSSFLPDWFLHLLKAGLCAASVAHLFIDGVEIYAMHYCDKCDWLRNNPKGKKNMAISTTYYRVIDVTMASTTLTYTVCSTLMVHTNLSLPVTLIQLTYALAMITISWSMLHYLQIHSHIGVFIMCIERMFTDLWHFLIVFVLFCVPFVYSFSSIVYEDYAYTHFNSSGIATNPYFTNLWKSHYTVFTIILNMVNFDQIGISHNSALYILHTLFVMIVVILLMNLLIAKFSSSVAVVTENKKVLLTIQTLVVLWFIEFRYKWILPCWLYKKLRGDTFPSMDERLYVRDILIRPVNRQNNETNV